MEPKGAAIAQSVTGMVSNLGGDVASVFGGKGTNGQQPPFLAPPPSHGCFGLIAILITVSGVIIELVHICKV
jgi:hypothetical protein